MRLFKLMMCLLIFGLFQEKLIGQSFKYKKGKSVFVDKNNKKHKDIQFDGHRGFYNGYCSVRNDDGFWGIINEDGKQILETKYEQVWILQNGIRFQMDNKIGLMNFDGETLVPAKYEWVENNNTKSILIKDNGNWKWLMDGEISDYVDESVADCDFEVLKYNCEASNENNECNRKIFLQTIYKTIRYSPYARQNGIQGEVLVEIIFDENGQIEKKEIIESLEQGCDEEALFALDRVNDLKFEGAKKDGFYVKSKVVFPVKFRLE